MVIPVNSMSTGPLSQFICCTVSSLIRSSAVWNTVTVGKTFFTCKDATSGRSITCGEDKSISRVSVSSSKNKMLSHPWWKGFSVIKLPPDNWLIILGSGATLGTPYHSLLLADWALSSSHSAVSLGEWKSMLLSPRTTFILATTATLSLSPLGDDRGDCEKRLTSIHRTSHSSI